jgi:hypothetical protein
MATPASWRLVWLGGPVAAFLCAPAFGGSQQFDFSRAVLVTETNQPSYVQHAVRALQSYLSEITSIRAPISTSLPAGTQPVIFIGRAAAGQACCPSNSEVGRVSPSAPRGAEAVRNARVWATADGALGETRPTFKGVDELGNTPGQRLREPVAATLGEEGYVIRSWTQEGREGLVVSGANPKGTKFGVYALMGRIRPRGPQALLEGPVDVVSKPAFALRGMHLNGWPFKYPYSFRPWPERDWQHYIDLLSCQGVNLLYLWPFMEIIPLPLSPPDAAYLAEFRRVVDYAQREHGMEVWMMQSANRVAKSNCGVPDPRLRPYWRPEQVDLNPGDPEQLRQILDSRKALYQAVNNVDGVCTIDCDPGGWPGAPLSDWAKIFNGCRSLLDEYNVHKSQAKQIAWLHLGWGRTTPVRLDYPMGDIIKGLEQSCRGPLLYIAGWPALLPMCQDAGVLSRTVALPYSTIEPEPSYPTTRIALDGVSNILQVVHSFPGAAGAMGNVQCPLIQFPRTHYLLSSFWDRNYVSRSEPAVLKDASALLYPEHAELVADCFAALRSTKPASITALADRLQTLIKEGQLGHPGVYGRTLFPTSNLVAESLVMQLGLRAAQQRLFQQCAATPTEDGLAQLLLPAFDAYLTWDNAHGWHDLWGTGWPQSENPLFGDPRLPHLVKSLKGMEGGNSAVERLLSRLAHELSPAHEENNVRAFCTEPLKRLALKPVPIRSLAQQATATASIAPKPSVYPPRQAVDGDLETLYWPGALITTNAEWLQLTWDKPQTIRKAIVHFLQNPSMLGRTIHLQREVSPGVWRDFATTVIPNDALASHAVATFELPSPVTLDKLRIVNLLDLFEVELY